VATVFRIKGSNSGYCGARHFQSEIPIERFGRGASERLTGLSATPPERRDDMVTTNFTLQIEKLMNNLEINNKNILLAWSGRRESNPRMKLGKLPFYH
jgi:hypothetical protein